MRSVGLDPRVSSDLIEIIALIDPEKPPRGIKLIESLWRLMIAIDLELVRRISSLEIAQRSFKRLAARIDRDNLRYSISLIALLVPDVTIIPSCSADLIKDLKTYAGASTGEILIEACNEKDLEELRHLIGGIIITA
jgi:hypothetical protein